MQNLIGYVSKEAVRQEFFCALEEEDSILLCLKRRGIADPPVFASKLKGVLPLYDRQIVLILKHSVGKKLRQSARIAKAHTQGIEERKNVRDSGRTCRVSEIGTMTPLRCTKLVEDSC